MLTINRSSLTPHCVERTISSIGLPRDSFEVLILDNGSSEQDIISWGEKFANVHIKSPENIGVAAGLNRLIAIAKGEYIIHIGNDMLIDPLWGASMVEAQEAVPSTGVCAIHCVELFPPLAKIGGLSCRPNKIVFGPKCIRRKLAKYEEFSKYGFEDSFLSLRLYYAGYYNYYLDFPSAQHAGIGEEDVGDYRKMKNDQLAIAEDYFLAAHVELKNNDLSRY